MDRCEFGPSESLHSAWQSVLKAKSCYSYFQTPHWSKILSASLPESTMQPAWFTFSDGVEAVLPLFSSRKRFGFHKLESLPWGVYGDLLSASPITHDHREAAAKKLLSFRAPIFECRFNPLDVGVSGALRTHPTDNDATFDVTKYTKQTTHILAVPDNVDALWSKFQSRNRSTIRRAREEGVTVRAGSDESAVRALQRLYQVAQNEYWSGVETVPTQFFDALVHHPDERVQVWLAEYNGEVIAADLVLYGKQEAQYFVGASNREHSKLNAPRALMASILEDACERKISHFNFGGSAGQSGVGQFKGLFGAEEKDYFCYHRKWLLG
ncbi:MAG: GNAT family N-acetyltransferase [Candidatus Hinthialibacter antarcticus]|nr:GNAT family N-acetyltransferase [Candidatus Hinthialibacter antarcticus]